MSEIQEVQIPCIDNLDDNDPIESASKELFKACLATGQIPLEATKLSLILSIETLKQKINKKTGEERWEAVADDNEISTIVLSKKERSASLLSYGRVWLTNLRTRINSDDEIVQIEYEKSFTAFKNALKFILSTSNNDDNDIPVIDECLEEIQGMKNKWAFEQFMALPKQIVIQALFKSASGIEEELDSEE